jgi:flagellar basal body L-ring protein FlgH
MKTYVANWHIKSGARLIEPGERITLDDERAQSLGAAVTLVIEDAKQKKQAKQDSAQ